MNYNFQHVSIYNIYMIYSDNNDGGSNSPNNIDYMEIRPPATDLTLEEIFVQYGCGMFVTGIFGGFGCIPQAATSSIMYAIGAEKPAPQYLSVVLLLVAFYSSGFELVRLARR